MTQATKRIYEFGSFRLDAVKRLLWREGEPVPLTSKSFETLLALVESRGEILDKDELLSRVWPDTVVEEKNLTINISTLRKALGESPQEHRYIVTVPGRGYRFVADVEEISDAETAQLMVQQSKMSVVVEEEDDGATGRRGDAATERISAGARSRPAVAASPGRPVARSVFTAIALLVALLAGGIYWWKAKPPVAQQLGAIKTLAVLPFKSLNPQSGPNSNEDYLGVGMADVMITRLSNLSQIIVRPTSSVLPFSGTDSLQAGQTLKVDSVLDGSIQQDGNRVRVTVRLLRTSDGQPLWSYKYDEVGIDVFQLQDTISEKVAEALALRLTGREKQQLAKRYTENLKAFQNYTQGRSQLGLRTRESLLTAIGYYEKAIAEDPNYALAYAGIAEVYANLGGRAYLAPSEARHKAEDAVQRALALDESLAEVHLAIAEICVLFAPFELARAERELRRALDLSPNLASVHQYLGNAYVLQARYDESVQEFVKARELDPLSSILARLVAGPYYYRRDYARALELLRQANELRPSFVTLWEVGIYIENRLFDEALAELEKEKQQRKGDAILIESTGKVYAAQGRRPEALQVIRELETMSGPNQAQAQHIAAIYTILGEKEEAFAWLHRALEAKAILFFIKDDPLWDPIRSDPRFTDLLRRIGLTD